MKHEHNAFENQIFHSYREKAKQINRAIELLLEHNYIIVDLESQILHKSNEKKTPFFLSKNLKIFLSVSFT